MSWYLFSNKDHSLVSTWLLGVKNGVVVGLSILMRVNQTLLYIVPVLYSNAETERRSSS